ncbi:MAG: leucyl aminopeptidase [bacterium]|nr:leucyl aminopeptidase [bacterium]
MTLQWEQTNQTSERLGEMVVVALSDKGIQKGTLLSFLDHSVQGGISQLLKKEGFKGKGGEARLFPLFHTGSIRYLLAVGAGKEENALHGIRKLAIRAAREARRLKVKSICIELPAAYQSSEALQTAIEGVILGGYQFDQYKSESEPSVLQQISFFLKKKLPPIAFKKAVLFGEKFGTATNFARDLVNTPACDQAPRVLGRHAEKIGKLPGISVRVYTKAEIEKMGMRSFLAVAQGSVEPPVFIHLKYKGRKKQKVGLIGKGITFDSGGLSLKPGQAMETMKCDMSGAAAVLAVFSVLSELKPEVSVEGFIAATENMPSGSADRPGDIVRTLSGKTIEILNTDAEGRLTLADAITFALRQKPDVLIDTATLTGACVVALGELCAGIMGNDPKLVSALRKAGERSGEKIWELPLIEEYKELIKSPIADLKNIGGKGGGTITAGLFLQEFVGEFKHWAHIDIAGPAFTEKEFEDLPRGGTGSMVRTFLQYLLNC